MNDWNTKAVKQDVDLKIDKLPRCGLVVVETMP